VVLELLGLGRVLLLVSHVFLPWLLRERQLFAVVGLLVLLGEGT
jgi:hypothetical protein